jgi:tetratricopeptide (TPR) repeat protein
MRASMDGRIRTLLAGGLCVALLGSPTPAIAQGPEATADATAAARAHFAKGRDLYQAGSYREAIIELDAARALDPHAKELVYNLAIVHEKLGNIDEALRYAKIYLQMDLDPAERTRAEGYVKRLEGAKAEVIVPKAEAQPETESKRARGRLDAATITVGAVAIAAAGVGAVFGVKALVDQPSNAVTGPNETFAQEQSQQNSAHTEAIVADVCFGGAIAAAVAATVLYFARYKDEGGARKTGLAPGPGALTPLPWVGPSAAGLVVGGSF